MEHWERIASSQEGVLLLKKMFVVMHQSFEDAKMIGKNLSWDYLEECLQKDFARIVRDAETSVRTGNGWEFRWHKVGQSKMD